jgi:SsrA-binding protein
MSKLIVKNKKGYYEYTIIDKYIAGIQLKGSEVKSVRANKVSINEAYCFINDGEIFIKGMHIAEHLHGGRHNNHIPTRDRKLLLKKSEIIKLKEKTSQKGLTIIPLEVIISDTGFVKVEIGLARGKNTFDKSQAIKIRDLDRELKIN